MDLSVVESGALAIVAVLCYGLIDKVIVPLIQGRKSDGHDSPHPRDNARRLDRAEKDIVELRASLSEFRTTHEREVGQIRAATEVSQAILQRLENKLQ